MQRIQKQSEPECLEVLRETPGADWNSVHGDQKQAMRKSAHVEQHGLCAYCMSTLPGDDKKGMTIEHFIARAAGGALFEWSNLLGVCLGDVGCRDDEGAGFHCDKYRGYRPVAEQELHVHPARFPPDAAAQFRYTITGEILPGRGLNAEQQRHVQVTIDRLNLNIGRLRRNRAEVLSCLRTALGKCSSNRRVREQARARLAQLDPGLEYAEVARQYLTRKLAGRTAP